MKHFRWIFLCLFIVPSGLADLLQATDPPLNLKGATGQTAEWLKAFEARNTSFEFSREPAIEQAGLRLIRISYPSPMETPFKVNNTVPAELYLPLKTDGPLPAAIVLDILNGSQTLPRMVARSLALRGVAAIYFPMPYASSRKPARDAQNQLLDEDVHLVAAPFRQAVMDIRRAKAILATLPEINPRRIGITGISLGGITASLAAGVDGEFYRVAPVLAGGDLPTIIFHARETRKLREQLSEHNITREQFATLVAPVDPLNFASRIDPGTCVMFNAADDDTIPKACTTALNHAFGDPTLLWMGGGHYSVALYLPLVQEKIADLMLGREVKSLEIKR